MYTINCFCLFVPPLKNGGKVSHLLEVGKKKQKGRGRMGSAEQVWAKRKREEKIKLKNTTYSVGWAIVKRHCSLFVCFWYWGLFVCTRECWSTFPAFWFLFCIDFFFGVLLGFEPRVFKVAMSPAPPPPFSWSRVSLSCPDWDHILSPPASASSSAVITGMCPRDQLIVLILDLLRNNLRNGHKLV